MKVAVQGCCHGELDKIFASVRYIQETQNITIDLLIICGDFQAMRNTADLASMACPDKYKHLGTFYQYYSGQKTVPVPTIFVGGNHEASNYLWELYHGGWVCPNIYFLGFAGCVRFGSVRIAGISGIYKENHYNEGHYERFPYNDGHVRSIYHVRKFNVYRLAQINTPVDIFLSHDWPTGIAYHGNTRQLLQFKKHFKSEVQSNTLGSPPNEFLLRKLKPSFWFAAHLHVKFAALFDHDHVSAPAPVSATPSFSIESIAQVDNADEIKIDSEDDDIDPQCVKPQQELSLNSISSDEPKLSSPVVSLIPPDISSKLILEKNLTASANDTNPVPFNTNPDEIMISDSEGGDDDKQNIIDHTVNSDNLACPNTQSVRASQSTKFLALDKCLPGRDFLQIVDIPTDPDTKIPLRFYHDEEWLAIVRATHQSFSDARIQQPFPSDSDTQLQVQRERVWVRENILKPLQADPSTGYPIIESFSQTASAHDPFSPNRSRRDETFSNIQTVEFCKMLQIPNKINPHGTVVEPIFTSFAQLPDKHDKLATETSQ
ncbi:hypothetical protein BDV3_002785 [Batrachochytrium dendrobatidis]|nr:lariat debranching enzyme [Batrachochytrium dendrobatidis]